MSVDDRVKLTCSPHYTYYMGRRVVPANGGSSDHSINQYPEMVERLPYTISDSELELATWTRMRTKCRVELAFLSIGVPP